MSEQKIKGKPFIIWTLQRTGGTNLTQKLIERSSYKGIEHEPFNIGRMFGYITEQWLQNQDKDVLIKNMQEILARNNIIKHCVEIVPLDISMALAEVSSKLGYQHLFLYRKNSRDRLLSLHFAKETGVWGPKMRQILSNENIRIGNLSIDKLLAHESKSARLLQSLWQYLLEVGAKPVAISYEELYKSSPNEALKAIRPVLRHFSLSVDPVDDNSFFNEVINEGDQGTRDRYKHIDGVNILDEKLKDIKIFNPKEGAVSLLLKKEILPDWVVFFNVVEFMHALKEGQEITLTGVLVLNTEAPKDLDLHFIRDGNDVPVSWGHPSPIIHQRYPEIPSSSNSRFYIEKFNLIKGETFLLMLKQAEGIEIPLLYIQII